MRDSDGYGRFAEHTNTGAHVDDVCLKNLKAASPRFLRFTGNDAALWGSGAKY